MAHDNTNKRERATQEHEMMLQRITAQYIDAYDRGEHPSLDEYIRRYPDFAADLLDFGLFYHGFVADVPLDIPSSAPGLFPESSAALQRIRQSQRMEEIQARKVLPGAFPKDRVARASASRAPAAMPPTRSVEPIKGILAEAAARKLNAKKLAAMVDVTSEVLAKLDARAISVSSIPSAFLHRLAQTLEVPAGSIRAYLTGTSDSPQASAFFFAESAPEQRQESFLQAIEASGLPDAEKHRWRAAAEAEGLAE